MPYSGTAPAFLLVKIRLSPLGAAALAARNPLPDAEPANVVLISARAPGHGGDCLAVLPPEVDDSRLFQALHAALAQPEVPASGLPSRSRRTGRKVLVAEDNRINQQVIDRMLKSAGHAVTLVDDGGQALTALEPTPSTSC